MGFSGGSVVKNPPAMQETQVPFLCREDPLEEEMVTHSGILAWRIPWTEEPGYSPWGLKELWLSDWAQTRDTGEPFCFFEKWHPHAMRGAPSPELQSSNFLEGRGDIPSCFESLQCTEPWTWDGVPLPNLDSVSGSCAVINVLQSQLPEGLLCVFCVSDAWKTPHVSRQLRALHSGSFLCSGMAVLCSVSAGTQMY